MSFQRKSLYSANPNTVRGQSTKLYGGKDKLVYANGRTIIIRDLNNPELSITYAGHTQSTTVARLSPTGYYCASADVAGNVRVWDIVGTDQTLKGEYKVIAGKITDLAWDGESKRIIAVGDAKDKSAHAFMADGGNSCGEIGGHSKPINAVSIRAQRPFRAATASDDNGIVLHQGVPYKYEKTIKTHVKFVQDVQFAPSGDLFASVGSDAKVFLYDGKTGDTVADFGDAHKGTIMACGWDNDSKLLATASADCTVKLWNAETKQATTTWTLGSGVNHQQVGLAWARPDSIATLSMSGDINLFDPRVGEKPARVLYGAQKAITAGTVSASGTFVAGTADGRVLSYDTSSREATYISGESHSNLVSGLATSGDKLFSVGYDDRVREIESTAFAASAVSLASQPRSVAVSGDGTTFVAGASGLEAVRSSQKLPAISLKFTPSAVAATGSTVAVGGEDQKVHLCEWDGTALKEVAVLEGNKGIISALACSPDGTLLASGDSSGKIVLFNVKDHTTVTSRWTFHSARINALAWTSDGQHCASGSLDTHVYVWSVQKPMKNIGLKNVGPGGVNAVSWLGSTSGGKGTLATAGAEGCVKVWDVTFHA